jgi:uncharacterized protein DUF4432
MKYFGEQFSRRELEALTGRLEQIAGVRRFSLSEGKEKGVEQIEVRNGAGLRFLLSPDRGLDISLLEFGGASLSWHSMNGNVHPSYFDTQDIQWLRSAAGGMLMTCGYTQVGSPCVDDGEHLPVHGRAHHTPADQVSARTYWEGDECFFEIFGRIHETRMFGENLEVDRKVICKAGENSIVIEDTIRNVGFQKTPFMVLYHFNFGFPLLSESTQFSFPSQNVKPREETTPLEGYDQWSAPDPDFAERVYFHTELKTTHHDADRPMSHVQIINPEFPLPCGHKGIKVNLAWSNDTLPNLVQWKMPGAGMHVMGIEPSNCWVHGRVWEKENGTLQYLEPGQVVVNRLVLSVQ